MVSNHFAFALLVRVSLLTIVLMALSLAITHQGFYGTTLLFTLIAAGLIHSLYQYVNQTNAEISRFLASVHNSDYSQRAKHNQHRQQQAGAGFEQLNQAMTEIMQQFNDSQQRQQAQLRHLKSLTEHIPVPLLSVFPDGKVQLHNNAARHLFGQITINKIEDLNVFNEGFSQLIQNLEVGKRQLINFTDESLERQLTMTMSQIVTGSLHENLISLQDIQNELDNAQMQAWQDLVRVLTHEIMNSITPVASLAKTTTGLVKDVQRQMDDLITENNLAQVIGDDLADVYEAVDTVSRRSDSLIHFVQSYRSLTQQPDPEKQRVCLTTLFKRMEELFYQHWQDKNITLTLTVSPENLSLNADPDLVEQILINLLQNAEQALLANENKPLDLSIDQLSPHQVNVSAQLNLRGHVIIVVEDNGPGISSTISNEIFVPFFTTKREGSGVGLALSRQIMNAHGGNITVGSSTMKGAKFTLIF